MKDLPLDEDVEHVTGTAPVMGLAFAQLQGDRQALGIDKHMDFRRKAAPRATHATGSVVFLQHPPARTALREWAIT